jgi:hypothetical protein
LAVDYLYWLSEEASGLPELFSSVNENFATAAIEGALMMVGDSVDLDVVQGVATKSDADILPARPDIQRPVREVLRNWWCSFGYDYVLSAIRAKNEEVLACL